MKNHGVVLKLKLMWCLRVVGLGINYNSFQGACTESVVQVLSYL